MSSGANLGVALSGQSNLSYTAYGSKCKIHIGSTSRERPLRARDAGVEGGQGAGGGGHLLL